MTRLSLLICFIWAPLASGVIDPRGNRPVEQGTRSEKCATQTEYILCTTDDWGPKCPSGCRIQGLMDNYDRDLQKKIDKIRHLLELNTIKHRSTDQVSKQTYDYLKEKLTLESGNDNNYYNLAQNLRQRITDMKIKIDRQVRILAALKDRVKDQVVEMQRLEVDIDIKLRSCKGSCAGYSEYQVDHEGYVALDKQINQLESQPAQESVGTLYVMKSRPLKDAVVDNIYKSKDVDGRPAEQQAEDMFPEVKTVHLVLEVEGSQASPATISKVPGTSYSPSSFSPSSSSTSSSSSSSSSTSTSSKSITDLGGNSDFFGTGGGFEAFNQPATTHVSSQSVTCTKSIKRIVVQTREGPVERMEEVIEGGPQCQSLAKQGGMNAFFPTLSHTGGTKGGLANTKTAFGNPSGTEVGFDLGAFLTDNAEDDLPDFHARSLSSTRVEREADYIGKVCDRLMHYNQDGRRSDRHAPRYRTRRCRAKSDLGLCTDDDWVSKCPSGCRLQGLMSQMEHEAERKLRNMCKTVKTYEDTAAKTMTVMTQVYNYNRRAIVSRYMSELKFTERADELARKLTSLRARSSMLSQKLEQLHRNVQKQIKDLYRTEVDIDMKLRACRGSCLLALPFSIDHLNYQMLQTKMEFADKTLNQKRRAFTPPEDIPHINLQPVDIGPAPSTEYKTIPTVQRELLTQFEDIGQNQVVLEDLLWEAAGLEALDRSGLE